MTSAAEVFLTLTLAVGVSLTFYAYLLPWEPPSLFDKPRRNPKIARRATDR